MTGPTKAELVEDLEVATAAVRARQAEISRLGDELARTTHALHLAEAAADYSLAEHHPRWTKGGELVLIGDVGRFYRPGDTDTGEDQVVVSIDGTAATVTTVDGWTWRWADCAELTTRARLPRAEPVDEG